MVRIFKKLATKLEIQRDLVRSSPLRLQEKRGR
jgi:hypothetical protein